MMQRRTRKGHAAGSNGPSRSNLPCSLVAGLVLGLLVLVRDCSQISPLLLTLSNVGREEPPERHECPKQLECPACPKPPACLACPASEQPKASSLSEDAKDLITLQPPQGSHATFVVSVTASEIRVSADDFHDVPDFGFRFPNKCAEIQKWCVEVSLQEKVMTALFRESFPRAVSQYQQSSSKLPPLFVDVGSNCGFYSMLAASLGMQVHAYDIQPACILHVAESVAHNRFSDHVHVFWAGMSDGVERIFDSSSLASGCYGAFPAHRGPVDTSVPQDWVRVPLTSIDDRYSSGAGGSRQPIHFLKVDTEGNEIKVMQGAMKSFEEHLIRNVIMEFTPMFYGTRGYKKQDAVDALCKILGFGYEISWHWQEQALPDCEAVTKFFEPTWEDPGLSRDLLFVLK